MNNENIREIDLELPEAVEPSDIPSPAAKADVSGKKKKDRKDKNGVGLLWVMALLLMTNMAWFAYVKLYIGPQQNALVKSYAEAAAEKDEEIERIKAVYSVREEDFEKRLKEAEEKITELTKQYDDAQKLLTEYRKELGR